MQQKISKANFFITGEQNGFELLEQEKNSFIFFKIEDFTDLKICKKKALFIHKAS